MNDDERQLWQVGDLECVMISCCSGAELQIRHATPDADIILRELYPTKSDVYQRARDLKNEYRHSGMTTINAERAETAEK